jgi:hypothetical protein
MSYIVIVTILFTNLFIGIVLAVIDSQLSVGTPKDSQD